MMNWQNREWDQYATGESPRYHWTILTYYIVTITDKKVCQSMSATELVCVQLSIVDIFHWFRIYGIAQTTPPGPKYREIVEEKRKGILNHLIGIHKHKGNKTYKKCTHGPSETLALDNGKQCTNKGLKLYITAIKMVLCTILLGKLTCPPILWTAEQPVQGTLWYWIG